SSYSSPLFDMVDALLVVILRPLVCTLFPYTTLFRSWLVCIPFRFYAGNGGTGYRCTGLLLRWRWWLLLCSCVSNHMKKSDHVFQDRKSTRLNSSHVKISYAVFCLQNKIESLSRPIAL